MSKSRKPTGKRSGPSLKKLILDQFNSLTKAHDALVTASREVYESAQAAASFLSSGTAPPAAERASSEKAPFMDFAFTPHGKPWIPKDLAAAAPPAARKPGGGGKRRKRTSGRNGGRWYAEKRLRDSWKDGV